MKRQEVLRRIIGPILVTCSLPSVHGQSGQDPFVLPQTPHRRPQSFKTEPVPADWPGVEYAEVRAYLYNPGDSEHDAIVEDGKLHPTVEDAEGMKLNAAQTGKLLAALRNKAPDGSGSCFIPHHGFVFHDASGKPVASVSVCFLCESGRADPGGHSMRTWDWAALSSVLGEAGLPVFKDDNEADAHFIASAKMWPEAKFRKEIELCLFDAPFADGSFGKRKILAGVGSRTQLLVIGYLGDKSREDAWMRSDPQESWSRTPLSFACELLGAKPPPEALPLLVPFLDTPDDFLLSNLLDTIARIGTVECVPVLRDALRSGKTNSRLACLSGLERALQAGTLQPDVKRLLFAELKAVELSGEDLKQWTTVLLGLDPELAVELISGNDYFRCDSEDLRWILEAAADAGKRPARDRLISLIEELRRKPKIEFPLYLTLTQALRLLGQHRHPEDLSLLESIVSDKSDFVAGLGCPGLLAWHGLEDYQDRLEEITSEDGYATLNRKQQFHVAVSEFSSIANGLSAYFSSARGGRWRDALEGAKAMNYPELAALVEEAAAKFGGEGPAIDEAERSKQLKAIIATDPQAFALLEKKREALRWWVVDLMLNRYAIANPEAFR
jgi:hypothetical protein